MAARYRAFFLIFLIGIILIAGAVIFYYTVSQISEQPHFLFINDTTIVNIEIVIAPELRQRGLSGRKSLDKDSGMFFIFTNKAKPGFWMKEMLFPIDIIWINDNTIVGIEHNVSPALVGQELTIYYPPEPINRVLEVNAGFASTHHLQVGDKIRVR